MPTLVTTGVFESLLEAWNGGCRRSLQEGGTSSSKTWSILQFLMWVARQAKEPLLISIVSESLPHLKRGCIRDFFRIIEEDPDHSKYWSKTEFTYKRPDWKGTIEFFGADDSDKVRGPRRDILFINEGNNVPWEAARGLDIRTNLFTIVDWNPVAEFWVHQYPSGKDMIQGWIHEKQNHYYHSTYLDALNVIPQDVMDNIEAQKKDPNWWNIYGLGLLGKIEGLVHPDFEQRDFLPEGHRFYGLDFGFLGDPVALTRNVMIGDKLYSQELIYETGMTNDEIGRKMDLLGVRKLVDPVFADPSEPKSIEEIRRMGFNIKESMKGKGSVAYGIQKVNQFYQFWTKDSVDGIKEQRNYRYLKDKDGNFTENTTHQWSHLMDSRRYALAAYIPVVHTNVIPVVSF